MGPALFKAQKATLFTWVVLAPLLRYPTLFLQFAEDPVEVVGFDFQLFGDLRSRDTRVLLDQGYGLIGTGTATPTPTATRSRS
jgi:hypothetical protein